MADFKKNKCGKNRTGFTLVETILYVLLFSLFVSSLAAFLNVLSSSKTNNIITTEVDQQGTFAAKIISQTLRNAGSVNIPSLTTNGTILSVNTNLASTTPTVFSVTNGVLSMTEGLNQSVALTNSKVTVSNINFVNVGNSGTSGSVHFNFTVSAVSNAQSAEYNYSSVFNGAGSLRK